MTLPKTPPGGQTRHKRFSLRSPPTNNTNGLEKQIDTRYTPKDHRSKEVAETGPDTSNPSLATKFRVLLKEDLKEHIYYPHTCRHKDMGREKTLHLCVSFVSKALTQDDQKTLTGQQPTKKSQKWECFSLLDCSCKKKRAKPDATCTGKYRQHRSHRAQPVFLSSFFLKHPLQEERSWANKLQPRPAQPHEQKRYACAPTKSQNHSNGLLPHVRSTGSSELVILHTCFPSDVSLISY